MSRGVPISAAIGLVTLLCGACFGAAPDATTKRGVAQLLITAEKNTPMAVAESRALYDKLKAGPRGDRRVDLAYGAALVQQRRYREARGPLTSCLEASPDDIRARMLKIRAALGEHRTADVLDDSDILAGQLAAARRKIPKGLRSELARRLGEVFAYLELARPDQTQVERRLASKNRLLNAFSDDESAAFDSARTETAELVRKFDAELEAERRRIERLETREAEAVKSALDDAKEKLGDQNDVLQSSQESASEAEREANVLAMQLVTLRQERARVGARFAAIQAQIQSLTTSTYSYSDLTTPGNPNPIATSTNTTTTASIGKMAQANALAFQLAAVNRQALDMDRKILALQSRMAEVSGEHEKSAVALQESDAASRDIERKAEIAEKKLKQKPRVSSARTTALRAQLTNFSTYAPFDYEAEKARVLKMFDE